MRDTTKHEHHRHHHAHHPNHHANHHPNHHPHHHEHGHGHERQHHLEGGPPHHGHRGGGRGRGHGGLGGDRARRGEARYIVLDALRDGPRHGYEIIKALEERSSGRYSPSPGTVYPTLQYLEELLLVQAELQGERRVYRITEAGEAELTAHAEEIAAFWGRFSGQAVDSTEAGFLGEDLEALTRTTVDGIRTIPEALSAETIRNIRQAISHCRDEVRRLLSDALRTPPSPNDGEPGNTTSQEIA